jgi:hypothetical protein
MPVTSELGRYLAQMTRAEVVPRPENESWDEHVRRIGTEDRVNEVSEEDYYHWLEVLPPRWMQGAQFCFAEGEEAFRLFWRQSSRYSCRQLTRDETLLFCSLAGMRPPSF